MMAEETTERRAGLKTALVFAMLFAVLGAVVVIAFLTTFRQPVTTLILVRHAEKIIDPNKSNSDPSPSGQSPSTAGWPRLVPPHRPREEA